MLHGRDNVRWVMSSARFPPDVALSIQAKEFDFHLISPQHLLHHVFRVFHVPFCKLQVLRHVPFSQEWPPSGNSPIKPGFVSFCRDCCPSGRFFRLSQGTVVVRVVIGFLVTSLTEVLLARLFILVKLPAVATVWVIPCSFHFPKDEAHCALGNFPL